jgi:NADH:ubiquinone oxidoreductase subunit E
MGAQGIVSAMLGDLGMDNEGDTPDNKVSIKLNTCLGACSQAPVIMVNHRLMGRATVESARSQMSKLPSNGH